MKAAEKTGEWLERLAGKHDHSRQDGEANLSTAMLTGNFVHKYVFAFYFQYRLK